MNQEELIKARKYFEKAKGLRIGLWMSELRRQFAIRMHKDGAESKHISAITFLRHDQIWHYLNRCKPNPPVEKMVVEKMDEWINDGLYPISSRTRINGVYIETSYELSEDPSYKMSSSRNINTQQKKEWDKIIGDLLV